MTKEEIKEVLKANCYVGESPNGELVYEFGEKDLELVSEELDHKINTLK
ncbi:hypothetical protein PG911_08755 [Tenacibaculum ovolyticum]|nr:hypothetical protein [Tenacibaculum ovolyticum]WBX78335.1 hypothetical protein PG911_08755 [Tenacibaculum ovolyticum]